jgi:hypothetical protein
MMLVEEEGEGKRGKNIISNSVEFKFVEGDVRSFFVCLFF